MNKRSYQQSTYKTIKQTKEYLLQLSIDSCNREEIEYLVTYSLDIDILRKSIQQYEYLQLEILSLFKKKIKTLVDGNDIEEAIIYLNILLSYHPSVAKYKWQLLTALMKYKDKDIHCYCLIRHLIHNSQKNITKVIDLLATNQSCSEKEYHYLAIEIYCLENKHKQAKEHVFALKKDDLEEYQEDLVTTNPLIYWKLLKKEKKERYSLQLGGH